MILFLASSLVLAASIAAPPKPATASGLFSAGRMAVRAVVIQACTVSSTGATCRDPARVRTLAIEHNGSAIRTEILF